jgi:hypothetical protein
MHTVTYVNSDGRMLDEGIGDEAIREFDTIEDAAMYVLEQAGIENYSQAQLGEVVDNLGMIDTRHPHRDGHYRWTIEAKPDVRLTITSTAPSPSAMVDMLHEVIRLIEAGNTSGYYPTWSMDEVTD